MKIRNKNYMEIGILPLILLPVIALTVGLTLWINDRPAKLPHAKYMDNILSDKLKAYEAPAPADTITPDEFANGDKAVFSFTGDTVLILPQLSENYPDDEKVLYKDLQGRLQITDLPTDQLKAVDADTLKTDNR